MYSFLSIISVSFFFNIIRDKDVFSSCPAKIETLSVTFLVLTLSPARAVDRFSAILSTFAKSLV